MSRLLRDFRYAARQLRRTPGFAALAILTLALGIGASAAVFAVVNELVFRPLAVVDVHDVYIPRVVGRPVARPNRARPATAAEPAPPRLISRAEFRAFQTDPPEPLVAVTSAGGSMVTIQVPGKARRVTAATLAGDYATVFRLTPQLGRFIGADDDWDVLAHVVISDRLWRAWFGGDRSVLGRTLTIGTRSFTIVGVAPRGFRDVVSSADLWLPQSTWRQMDDELFARREPRPGEPEARARERDAFTGLLYARARPGAPPTAVAAAFESFYEPWLGPQAARGRDARIALTDLWTAGPERRRGLMIVGLALIVLLAACANLANLLYARGARRAGEVAVRLSLGGTSRDVLRLFLAETTIIAAAASALGLALAAGGLRLTGVAATGLSRSARELRTGLDLAAQTITPDIEMMLFTLGAGAIAAVAVGLLTAWRASRVPPLQTLAAAGVPAGVTPRGRPWRVALVAIQVTAAVVLTMVTSTFVRQLADELDMRVRFDTAGITAARVDLSLHDYNATRGRAFYEDVLARVRQIPGVEAAALADGLPGHAYVSKSLFTITAEPNTLQTIHTARRVTAAYAGVSDGFLEAIGVELRRGRPLRPTDRYGAPLVAVVCESLAARLWPGADPIGQRLMFGNDRQWRTVVGVSSDPIVSPKDTATSCQSCVAFVPWDQEYRAQMLVMARSDRPAALVGPLVQAIQVEDAGVAIQEAAPLDETLLAWVRPARANTTLMMSLGVLALVIAGLGIYGVVSYLVTARTREFGVRMALGATPGRVVTLVLDHALHLMLWGLLPGVMLMTWGVQIIGAGIAKDVTPLDFVAVPIVVLLVGLVAGYVPARRAARIDPTVALRQL